MNKEKLIVDDIISVVLIGLFGFLVMFFVLIAIMAITVYPMSTLLLYGIYKIHKDIINKELNATRKVVGLLLGIGYISFAILILSIIFSQPHIPVSFIIYFLAMPIFLIGLAAVVVTDFQQLGSLHARQPAIFDPIEHRLASKLFSAHL